jgi:electron transport complex protein RnfG
MRKQYITTAWLVLTLALCFGGALAYVEITLGPRIEENRRREMLDQVPRLVPGADSARMDPDLTGLYGKPVARALDSQGETIGWAIVGEGAGYNGPVTVLIGLDEKLTVITGLYILEQKETPELGNKIVEPGFRDRFADQSALTPLTVVKKGPAGPGQIEAISGATISSNAVAAIVNKGVRRFRTALFEGQDAEEKKTNPLDAQPSRGDADAE